MASSDDRPPSVDRVPTLTEVVELGPAFPSPPFTQPPPVTPSFGPPAAWANPAEPMVQNPADMPELGGLLLADGPAWAAADDLPPLPDEEPAAPPLDAATLVALVLQDLAPRIDLLFEARLREAVAPALARAADVLVRDAREDLAAALRALVEQAVAQTLAQRDAG